MDYGNNYGTDSVRKLARQERISMTSAKIFFEDDVLTHLGSHDAILAEMSFHEIEKVEYRVKRAWDMIILFLGTTIGGILLCNAYIAHRGLALAVMIIIGSVGLSLVISASKSAWLIVQTAAGVVEFDTNGANVNEVQNFTTTLQLALTSFRENTADVRR